MFLYHGGYSRPCFHHVAPVACLVSLAVDHSPYAHAPVVAGSTTSAGQDGDTATRGDHHKRYWRKIARMDTVQSIHLGSYLMFCQNSYISVLCWQNMAMSHSCPKCIAVYNSSQDAVACASWDLSLLVVDHPSCPATATNPWIVTKLWTHHVHPACMGASASAASPWEGFEVSVLWEALIFSWMAACQGRRKGENFPDPWTPRNGISERMSAVFYKFVASVKFPQGYTVDTEDIGRLSTEGSSSSIFLNLWRLAGGQQLRFQLRLRNGDVDMTADADISDCWWTKFGTNQVETVRIPWSTTF